MRPPRAALLLMRLLLPRRLREPIIGDLQEEWHAASRPSPATFWALTMRSIAACWMDRLRGDVYALRRQQRRPTGDRAMQSLLQDVRYGCRLMWRSPGFTAAAVATLALGIGANSAIFSIINVLSLKPLPYHEASRVAFVLGWDVEENDMRFNLRQADYLDLQRNATTLEAIAAYSYLSATLTGGDIPERVQAYRVTPNTFSLLGVPALVGRTFAAADATSGRLDVAVVSHALWQRRFGSDPGVIGRRIVLNGEPHEIIGVMPPRFEYPVFNFKGDVWVPWPMRDAARGQPAATGSATVVARVRRDASYEQAQAELDVLMRTLAARYPETNRGWGARLVEMGKLDELQAGPAIALVLTTVAMVLLLACANVANLLLSRGAARHRELAVRAAIGASRLRLGRQLLVEGVLLALSGGLAGALLSMLALAGLRASLPEALVTTLPLVDQVGVDSTTLGFTLVISLLTSVIFGLLPAWRASRPQFQDGLRASASTTASRGTRRLRTGLVIAEVALSTLLLIASGLLVRSYLSVQRISPGFNPTGVLTMTMTLPEHDYDSAAARRQFYEEALARIERVGAVRSAALVNVLPFSTYDRGSRLIIEGAPLPEPGRAPAVSYRVASPGYYGTLQIPVVEGRAFDLHDTDEGGRVALINQTLARRYFVGQSAVGRRVRLGTADTPWLTIVGVVGDVRHSALTYEPEPEIHVPLAQAPASMMMLAVRADTHPEELAGPIRAAIQAIDPAQAVYHVKTLDSLVAESLLPRSTSAGMMVLMSALALTLAAVGVYGVVAYGVSQQAREFGVRIALGATPRDLLRQVLRQGLLMVTAGIALGVVCALAGSRVLVTALHGVTASDPVTYFLVIGLLLATGIAACGIPAWRAAGTAAVRALRAD